MMNLRSVRAILLGAFACVAWSFSINAAYGQAPDYANQETEGDSAGARDVSDIREAQPEVYYFRDSEDDLVPVPDITLEELTRLLALDLGLSRPDRIPNFGITELSVEGQAGETHAQLTISIGIKIRADGLTRVPLLLPDFVLQEPARFDGSAEYYSLDYDEEDGGYVAWIRAASDTQHTLTLVGGAPLAQIGQETRLRLNAPRALSPELSIVLPLESVRAMVVEGAGYLSTSAEDGGKTRLNVQGLRGNLQLSWQPTTTQPTRVMDVKGRILVKIMGPDEFQTEARLELKSFGQPIDTFRVRLPAGHELVSKESPEYTATTLQHESAADDASKIVEVKLTQKTEGRAAVLLETRLTRPPEDPQTSIDVAGFEVLGTLRQSGEIGISVVGEWSLDWENGEEGPQVRRVPELVDPIWPDPLDATFEYYRQPCSLRVRVWPRETYVSAAPTYVLRVDQHQVLMNAILKFKIQGASASSLKVDMEGWQVQSIESEGRINRDQLNLARVNPLVIPLADVRPGEFEIELQARRETAGAQDIDPELGADLVLNIPQPRATSLSPATVAIVPASNVQLTPRSEEMLHLAPTALPSGLLPPDERAVALCYRDRGDQGPSRLACDVTILAGTISVEVRGRVHVTPDTIQVEQTFDFDVRYEPADVLALSIPRQLIERDSWALLLNGQTVDRRSVRLESAPPDQGDSSLALINLSDPQYGKCQVEVRYELSMPAHAGSSEHQRLTVPLVMPANDERGPTTRLESTSLVIEVSEVTASLASTRAWTSHHETTDQDLTLVSQARADRVDLIVSTIHAPQPTSTVVELAFVQTWLTSAARQDRAVFRLRTGEGQIGVTLPSGAEHDAISVSLNQKQVKTVRTSADTLTIDVPKDGVHECVLELVYPFRTRPPVGAFAVELPTISGAKWTREVLWHLVTPSQEHLLTGPSGMSREERWSWKRFFWGRRPLHNQRELESRVGASSDYRQPSGDVNQYLYCGLGTVPQFQARTGMRHLILAVCSGLVLVVGLVLIYVPVLRSPSSLLVGCVTLAAIGILSPTTALIVAQAGGLGLVLVALARLLLWTVGRKYPQRSVIRGRTYPGPDTRSTELIRHARGEDSHVSASHRGSNAIVSSSDVKP